MRARLVFGSLAVPLAIGVSFAAGCGGSAASSASASTGGTGAAFGDGGAASLDSDGGVPTTMAPLDDGGDGTKLPNIGATRGPEPGRSRDDVLAMVQARRQQARACYDAALRDHPGIEGNIVIKWTVDPKGNVTDVGVDPANTQILEPQVGNCLTGIVMSFHFPESARGLETHASYPFNFHPRGTPVSGSSPHP